MRHLPATCDVPDLPIEAFRAAPFKNRPATLEGGGKGGGAPTPPDPYAVADATTQTNKQTAAFNKALNLNNYTNPFGSQQSQITGYDASGAPIYQTNINASSGLNSLLNNAQTQAQNANSINENALGNFNSIINQYGNLYNSLSPQVAQQAQQKGQDAAYASQTQYLDPQFSQQKESLDAQLANQGLTPGSEAYNNAMLNFNNQKQQAYSNAQNQSILTGSQIGTQNLQNQISGINTNAGLLGSVGNTYQQRVQTGQIPFNNLQQIAQLIPGYSGPATSSTSPADIGSNIYNQYQGNLNNYNAQQQSSNQTMGGLFNLGSAATMAFMSDRRLKKNIRRVGSHKGHAWYAYEYIFGSGQQFGVMADEVPAHAVIDVCGLKMVNYGAL